MRIVSLLPSTTEILFALGVGEDVVGVTFECDFPAEARGRRVVSGTTMPEGLDPADRTAIDAAARELVRPETAQSMASVETQARDVCQTPLYL